MCNNVLQFPATVAEEANQENRSSPGASRAHRCHPTQNSTASGSRQPRVAHGRSPPPPGRLSPLALGWKSPSRPTCRLAPRRCRLQAGCWGEVAPTAEEVPPSARAGGGSEPAAAATRRPPSPGDAPRGPATGSRRGGGEARVPAADPTPRATPPARLLACARAPRGGPPPGTPTTDRWPAGNFARENAPPACSTPKGEKGG